MQNGEKVKVDLKQYMPFGVGEASIRNRMSTFSDKKKQYTKMANQLLRLEYEKGRYYKDMTILWETWPKSSKGYYARNTEEDTTRSELVTVPFTKYHAP